MRTIAIAAGGAGFLALAFYMSADAWWRVAPKDTELARALREGREGRPQPAIAYVPTPAAVADQMMSTEPNTPVPVAAEPEEEIPLSEVIAAAVLPLPAESVRPEPDRVPEVFQVETETDVRRKAGIVEFERAMVGLSAKADQADIAWQRYLAGCRQNIMTATTSSVAVAGVANRDWIGVVGAASTSSVSIRTWTEACSEAGVFFALADQVSRGVCVAEDAARRSSVYPGTRRDLRTKYRLDWTGWDEYCR